MTHIVEIERMSYGSAAIGHLPDGKTTFVEGGAPGDTVEVEVIEDKGSFARARITRIVEPAACRVRISSPVDEACGTTPWQHLSYDAQLAAKRSNVVGALAHTARFEAARANELVAPCLPSKRQWNYRNKLELGAGADEAGRFIVGFHRDGSNGLVAADSSHLAYERIEKAPKALQGAIRFAQGNGDLGIFRIGVRHSLATGDTEVALWTKPGPFPRALFAKTLADACNATSVVRVLANPGKARKVKGLEVLGGQGCWRERIGDARFATQAPSFFQVNTDQAANLVNAVLEGLGENGGIGDLDDIGGIDGLGGAYVADLYAGGGTFSVPLALAGADVVAVEAAGSSVRDLRRNAKMNGVDIDVVGGDAAREIAALGELDALVVDPPRAGLTESAVRDIVAAHPQRIAYISCNPSTWARDISRFESNGYRLVTATPVDMFPQTYHVEIASFLTPA